MNEKPAKPEDTPEARFRRRVRVKKSLCVRGRVCDQQGLCFCHGLGGAQLEFYRHKDALVTAGLEEDKLLRDVLAETGWPEDAILSYFEEVDD